MTLFSRIVNTFVRIFTSLCNNEIGQYDPWSTASFPGLRSKTMFAFDMEGERTPHSRDILKTLSKRGSKTSDYCL